MTRLEIKNCNIILTEKQQKDHFHLEKFININILQVKKFDLLTKEELLKKLEYSPLENTFEKETKLSEEQIKILLDAITNQNKNLEFSINKDDLEVFVKKYLINQLKKFDGSKELTYKIHLLIYCL